MNLQLMDYNLNGNNDLNIKQNEMKTKKQITERLALAKLSLARVKAEYEDAKNEGLERLLQKDITKWEARIEVLEWVLADKY